MGLVLCLLQQVRTANAEFFQIFPVVDSAQHAVYEAESVQVIGTADADALEAVLQREGPWRVLRLQDPTQALMSVGVGDFRNSSCGPYRELAIAVPACEEELQLDCGSFLRCQEKLPPCAHTFMLQSYASTEAAVRAIRSSGISAELSSSFDFSVESPNSPAKPSSLRFAVATPFEELLTGEVEVFRQDSEGAPATRAGFRMQLFAARGGRHICGFPGGLAAAPARLVGDLHGGDFFREVGFQPEGALHLPALQVMRLPSWGAQTAPQRDTARAKSTTQGKASPLAAKTAPQSAPAEPTNFMDLVRDFNEGQAKMPAAAEMSQAELLQVHQEQASVPDEHSQLLAKIAASNPRARVGEVRENALAGNILEEL
ncbi:unnamed protein product [Effrenium voratum]|nr:unnamed protein product [Effrenium voratum]